MGDVTKAGMSEKVTGDAALRVTYERLKKCLEDGNNVSIKKLMMDMTLVLPKIIWIYAVCLNRHCARVLNRWSIQSKITLKLLSEI